MTAGDRTLLGKGWLPEAIRRGVAGAPGVRPGRLTWAREAAGGGRGREGGGRKPPRTYSHDGGELLYAIRLDAHGKIKL